MRCQSVGHNPLRNDIVEANLVRKVLDLRAHCPFSVLSRLERIGIREKLVPQNVQNADRPQPVFLRKIIPLAPEFIDLEKAKQIALEDAGLDETAQKIVFTREELSRNQGKPCYILEFYTDKCVYSYKVDAVSGEIIGKKTEWFSRQESETVPDTSQNSDSKQRRGN